MTIDTTEPLPRVLAFVDTETTGLDPTIHQPYEVCIWREDTTAPLTYVVEHTLDHADPQALAIGRYNERGIAWQTPEHTTRAKILDLLEDVTIVAANPGFDTAMLRRYLGYAPWHHRTINVSDAGCWVFGWDRPRGLADTAQAVRDRGCPVPEPDHTAQGDVLTVAATYRGLRALMSGRAL